MSKSNRFFLPNDILFSISDIDSTKLEIIYEFGTRIWTVFMGRDIPTETGNQVIQIYNQYAKEFKRIRQSYMGDNWDINRPDKRYADVYLFCKNMREDIEPEVLKLGFVFVNVETQVHNTDQRIWDNDLGRYNIGQTIEDYDFRG